MLINNPLWFTGVLPPLTGAAFFAGGLAGSTPALSAATFQYNYLDSSVVAGTSLSVARDFLAGAGNYTEGVFAGGTYTGGTSSLAISDVYTYASSVVAPGGNLSLARYSLAGAGNATVGVFGGGAPTNVTSTITNVTDLYTYASNTAVAGTNLTFSSYILAAAGNSVKGIFGQGYTPAGGTTGLTSVYTYAGNTTAAGSSLFSLGSTFAIANASVAIFIGGVNSEDTPQVTSQKYNLVSATVSAGANLSAAQYGGAATGNSRTGLLCGGSNGSAMLAIVTVYTYSGDTVSMGTSLSMPIQGQGATSSAPGAF